MTEQSKIRNQVNEILEIYNMLQMPFINEQAKADCLRTYKEQHPKIAWYMDEFFDTEIKLARVKQASKNRPQSIRTLKWREKRGILQDEW